MPTAVSPHNSSDLTTEFVVGNQNSLMRPSVRRANCPGLAAIHSAARRRIIVLYGPSPIACTRSASVPSARG